MPPNNINHGNSLPRRMLTSRVDEISSSTNSSNGGGKAIACCLVKSCPAGNLPFADLTQATTFIDFAPCTILILPCMATAKNVREARAVAELRNILQQEATLLDKRGLSVWRLRLDALTVIGKMSQLGFCMAEFGVNAVDGVHTWNMVCNDSNSSSSSSTTTPFSAVSSSSTPSVQVPGSSSTQSWDLLRTSAAADGASTNDSSLLFNSGLNNNNNPLNNSVTNYDGDMMTTFNTTSTESDVKNTTRYSQQTSAVPLDSAYNFLAAPIDDVALPAPSAFINRTKNDMSNSKSGGVLSMTKPLFLSGPSFASPASSSPSIGSSSSHHHGTRSVSSNNNMNNTQQPQLRDPNKHLLNGRTSFGLPSLGGAPPLSMAPSMNMFGGGPTKRSFDDESAAGGPSSAGGNRNKNKNSKQKGHHHSKSRKRLRRAVYQSVKVSSALLQTHGTNYLPDELKEPSVEFTPLLKRIQAWLEVHPECELRPKWVSVHPEGHKQCSAHFKCATWPCTLKEKDNSNKPDFRCPARIAVARDKITGMYRVHYEMITHEGHGTVNNNNTIGSSTANAASILTNDDDAVENENLLTNDFTLQQHDVDDENDDGATGATDDNGNNADDDDDDDDAGVASAAAGGAADIADDFMPSMTSNVVHHMTLPPSSMTMEIAGNGSLSAEMPQ